MTERRKTIQVIRIDAHTQKVSYEPTTNSLENMQKLLKTDAIQAQRLNSNMNVYILLDENARLWCEGERLFFRLSAWTLVNRAILVGVDDEGEWCDVQLSLADLVNEVEFLPMDYVDGQ